MREITLEEKATSSEACAAGPGEIFWWPKRDVEEKMKSLKARHLAPAVKPRTPGYFHSEIEATITKSKAGDTPFKGTEETHQPKRSGLMIHKRRAPTKLTAHHFFKIDELSKGDTHKGEMARFCAWNYMHLHSLSLGLRQKSQKLDPQQKTALARVKDELLFWIDCGPKPCDRGFQGVVPLHATRGLSVFRLTDGQPHNYPNRFALSIDPSQAIALIQEKVGIAVEAERKKMDKGRRHAVGQGKPPAYLGSWKALVAYKTYLINRQCKTKTTRQWWEGIPWIDSKNAAHKLTSRGRKMVNAAMNQSWGRVFQLR